MGGEPVPLLHHHGIGARLGADNNVQLLYDPIKESMMIQEVPPRGRTETPTKLMQVYVDDFCNAATQSKDGIHIPTIR
jgi:hypothetical protein